ncbi:MAG: membrane lipoprotein lipid attachment site-containing protein [Bacteroidales bacterium]|nr:membrane lipoprotein lipid attachment site-containing protein [Bacteroidales bacterium]
MKKTLFFTGLILALAACSNEESLQLASNADDQPQTIQSYTRSVDEAIAIATKAASDFGMPQSRSEKAVSKENVLVRFHQIYLENPPIILKFVELDNICNAEVR